MNDAQLGPLHGVHFTAKDALDTAGVLTQRGSPIFKGRFPDIDATSVATFKNTGAILIAKTNLPEFSYAAETDNLLTGRTNNPWNLDCTPGGSSGGESVAIAAGKFTDWDRKRCRNFGSRSGGHHRDRRAQGNAWTDPDDGQQRRAADRGPVGLSVVRRIDRSACGFAA
jgi:Amidase